MPRTLQRCVRSRSVVGALHRGQPRDQADDLRSADIEHRQHGALARGNLPHARRQRFEVHSGAAFFGRASSARPAAASSESRAKTLPSTRKSSDRMSRSRMRDWRCRATQGRHRGQRIVLGQLDVDARFHLEVPAPLADQHAGDDFRPQFRRGVEQRHEFAQPFVGAVADDEGQRGKSLDRAGRRPPRRPPRWRELRRPFAKARPACVRRCR